MLRFKIIGQLKSGKNNMLVTRSGHHYPNQKWSEWRDDIVMQIISQDKRKQAIDKPCAIVIRYTAGDRLRRDVPGILDALWHCLEKAEIVTDDRWLADVKFTQFHDKGNPHTEVCIK